MANGMNVGRVILDAPNEAIEVVGARPLRAGVLLLSLGDGVLVGPDSTSTVASPFYFITGSNQTVFLSKYTGALWAALPGAAFGNFRRSQLAFVEIFDDPTALSEATNSTGPGTALPLSSPAQKFAVHLVNAGSGAFSAQLEGSVDGQKWSAIGVPMNGAGSFLRGDPGSPAYTWARLNVLTVSPAALLEGFVLGL